MTRPSPLAPLLFAFHTIITQVICAGAALITWEVSDSLTLSLVSATVSAAIVATFLNLSTPWRLLNAALPLSIACTLAVEIPAWMFLAPLIILLGIYAPAFWTRVPYYPTSRAAYPLILAELPTDRPFTFIDIGCGLGDLLVFLRHHRPNGKFYGIEIGVIPFAVSKIKAWIKAKDGVTIRFQDMNALSLSQFEYVYAFLSPAAMTKVWQKAQAEMMPGSTFITNSFETPAPATYKVDIKDTRRGCLFVHKMSDETRSEQYHPAVVN